MQFCVRVIQTRGHQVPLNHVRQDRFPVFRVYTLTDDDTNSLPTELSRIRKKFIQCSTRFFTAIPMQVEFGIRVKRIPVFITYLAGHTCRTRTGRLLFPSRTVAVYFGQMLLSKTDRARRYLEVFVFGHDLETRLDREKLGWHELDRIIFP